MSKSQIFMMPKLLENVSLKLYNTFGVPARSRYLVQITNEEEAFAFLVDNMFTSLQIYILGGGSNILFLSDIEGVVLKNNITGINLVEEDNASVLLKVGAGENWHQFVLYCIKNGWGGIENLSLIPGSVGAAPIQNIGAYGVEVCSVCEKVEGIHLTTGAKHIFRREACKFGYRNSYFKKEGKGKYLITYVYFRLSKSPKVNISYGAVASELAKENISSPNISDVSRVIINIRSRKLPDPTNLGNAGSFFKNPVIDKTSFSFIHEQFPHIPHYPEPNDRVKIPAGWLIEKCGWKGYKEENIGVYERQALVLVNFGGGKGKEIFQLSHKIQQSVYERFNIMLEREVQLIPEVNSVNSPQE